jgi:ubiquitin-activating enzyme E1
LVIL